MVPIKRIIGIFCALGFVLPVCRVCCVSSSSPRVLLGALLYWKVEKGGRGGFVAFWPSCGALRRCLGWLLVLCLPLEAVFGFFGGSVAKGPWGGHCGLSLYGEGLGGGYRTPPNRCVVSEANSFRGVWGEPQGRSYPQARKDKKRINKG